MLTLIRQKKMDPLFLGVSYVVLAVFCGFLAEYQLEHKIEKDRKRSICDQ
jgi:hypothetical protein